MLTDITMNVCLLPVCARQAVFPSPEEQNNMASRGQLAAANNLAPMSKSRCRRELTFQNGLTAKLNLKGRTHYVTLITVKIWFMRRGEFGSKQVSVHLIVVMTSLNTFCWRHYVFEEVF